MKIAVISDIHEDIDNLKKAFKRIEKEKCDEIVCLGDISGFSVPYYDYYEKRNAHECLNLIKRNCSVVLLGNHDLHAIHRTPDVSPLFEYPENWFDLDYYEKKEISKDQLWYYEENELNPLYSNNDIEFLSSLKETEVFKAGEMNIFFSHHIYPNLSGSAKTFVFDELDFKEHFNLMKENDCLVGISGHMHRSGLYLAFKNSIAQTNFRKKVITPQPVINISPAICSSKINSGFIIFDTDIFSFDAIRIK
jgi:predicted phosphodiesterase